MHSIGGGIAVKKRCARVRPVRLRSAIEERAVLGVSGGVGRHEGHFAITLFPSRRNASKTHAPFFVTSSGVGSSTSRIAPLISTRSFFGDAYLKRPQPADPIDHVTGSISVPHDAIERLSYLVKGRGSMIQKVPSGLSIKDYRRNGLRYFRGDRGREPSYRCDAVDVRQIDLHLVQGLGGKRLGVRSEWCRIKNFSIIVW